MKITLFSKMRHHQKIRVIQLLLLTILTYNFSFKKKWRGQTHLQEANSSAVIKQIIILTLYFHGLKKRSAGLLIFFSRTNTTVST